MIAELVRARRLLVFVGGGGVGKTTLAAATALGAARSGRRALVLTIDPARRLASALGLRELEGTPRPVAPGLDAMMLDRKQAWDRLIGRHAPSAAARERILANRLYRDLSQAFAGAHEYLALEEVAVLAREGGAYEVVVVDTPPARHAFEFLNAPARLRGLIDRRFAWLLGASSAVGERVAGRGVLGDVGELLAAMAELGASFAARAGAARAMLASAQTGIVLVSGADERGVKDAEAGAARLVELGLPAAAVVVNRAHAPMEAGEGERERVAEELLAIGVRQELAAWMIENHGVHARLAAAERARIGRLGVSTEVTVVPRLEEDVHDLEGLERLAAAIGL